MFYKCCYVGILSSFRLLLARVFNFLLSTFPQNLISPLFHSVDFRYICIWLVLLLLVLVIFISCCFWFIWHFFSTSFEDAGLLFYICDFRFYFFCPMNDVGCDISTIKIDGMRHCFHKLRQWRCSFFLLFLRFFFFTFMLFRFDQFMFGRSFDMRCCWFFVGADCCFILMLPHSFSFSVSVPFHVRKIRFRYELPYFCFLYFGICRFKCLLYVAVGISDLEYCRFLNI